MTSTIPPACTGAKCVPKTSHAKKTLATGSIVAVIAVSAGLSQRSPRANAKKATTVPRPMITKRSNHVCAVKNAPTSAIACVTGSRAIPPKSMQTESRKKRSKRRRRCTG